MGALMSAATLLVILVVGVIAGWLAGQVVKGTGFGLVADIAIGIVGALIGSWLLPRLGIHLGSGIVPAIIGATIGAIICCSSSDWFTGEGGGDCLATVRCTITKETAPGGVVLRPLQIRKSGLLWSPLSPP
jgi:uncharacterized membrane protein YeaQ/YmgE (transglycosylase-associated protein family)